MRLSKYEWVQKYRVMGIMGVQGERFPPGAKYEVQVLDRAYRSKYEVYLGDEETELTVEGRSIPPVVLRIARTLGPNEFLITDEEGRDVHAYFHGEEKSLDPQSA